MTSAALCALRAEGTFMRERTARYLHQLGARRCRRQSLTFVAECDICRQRAAVVLNPVAFAASQRTHVQRVSLCAPQSDMHFQCLSSAAASRKAHECSTHACTQARDPNHKGCPSSISRLKSRHHGIRTHTRASVRLACVTSKL